MVPMIRRSWGSTPTIAGVRIGLQSSSFTYSGIGIEGIIKTMTDLGLGEIGVMSEHVENYLGAPVLLPGDGRPAPWTRQGNASPAGGAARSGAAQGGGPGRGRDQAAREALRKWRLEADLTGFRNVAKQFSDAGLTFFCYGVTFDDTFTEEEIDKCMLMTRALGTRIIYASSPASAFPRFMPFAEKHDVIVTMHNHTNGPEEFEQALAVSKNVSVCLDVGHFFASGYDPIAYLKQHHGRITNIHLKDRKKDRGPEMLFGEGDTPLQDVLHLLKREKYGFPAYIEYAGPNGPRVDIERCLDYCKKALA
jgi:sugar phosphate isomerase/epimerase